MQRNSGFRVSRTEIEKDGTDWTRFAVGIANSTT